MTTSESLVDPAGLDGRPVTTTVRQLRVSAWTRFLRSLATVLGTGAGLAVAWFSPDRLGGTWYPFAGLAALLGLAAGSSFGSGIGRRRDVNRVQRVSSARVLPVVAFFLLLAAAVMPLARLVVGDQVSWRGWAFTGLAVVGAIPVTATLAAIRVLSIDGLRGSPGAQLAGLIRLRRILNQLLTILGSLVVLVVLVNAAGLRRGRPQIPAGAVIFAGAAATVLVALMYVPTATILRRRSAAYVDEHFCLERVERAQLVAAAEERMKLEAILGLDRTTFGELQSALLIVSPLLASAGFSLLPI
jgi:hypothetical protein